MKRVPFGDSITRNVTIPCDEYCVSQEASTARLLEKSSFEMRDCSMLEP